MMKNKLKDTIEFVGLSYRKEILKIVLITLALLLGAALIFYFLKNIMYTIMILIALLVADYMLLTRYNDKKKMLIKARENELITLITYFEVYIRNKNNVYQSFKLIIPYCSNWMKKQVEELIDEIDNDKTVQPFINFAHLFNNISIQSLMLSIYQMVEQGESHEQLTHFDVIFDEISKNRNNEMIEQKKQALSSMSTFPLIGAGLITVSLTISILMILGDLVDVI
jgi:hypothetical protein